MGLFKEWLLLREQTPTTLDMRKSVISGVGKAFGSLDTTDQTRVMSGGHNQRSQAKLVGKALKDIGQTSAAAKEADVDIRHIAQVAGAGDSSQMMRKMRKK